MKTVFAQLISLLALACFATPAHADVVNPFYPIGKFNTVIFGDFTHKNSGDNWGYMAVGGNMTVAGGFGVATGGGGGRSGYETGDVGLVVGGNISVGSGAIYAGDAYYGGGDVNKLTLNKGTQLTECPVNFAAMESEFRNISAALHDMGTEATPNINQWSGQTSIDLASGGLNVLNIHLSDLAHNGTTALMNGLSLNGLNSDTQVVINLIGDDLYKTLSIAWETQIAEAFGENVMFNLIGIDELIMNSAGRNNFSILGVDTHLTMNHGNLTGYTVLGSATFSGAEFHDNNEWTPEIDIPTPPAATPEPATALIFALGLAGFPVYRRMTRKRHAV